MIQATAKFTFEAGALIRGSVVRSIESSAWQRGLDVDIKESKGFFESAYCVTIKGETSIVTRFVEVLQKWLGEIESQN